MRFWEKTVALKSLAEWEEKLSAPFSERLAVLQKPNAKQCRLQIYYLTPSEAKYLLKTFGGRVSSFRQASKIQPSFNKKIASTFHISTSSARFDSRLIPLRIPAGMAFGTGDHSTTAMCLRQLAQHRREINGEKVLDVGTGTGILALAASALGGKVTAFDHDADSISEARKNAALNSHIPAVKWQKSDIDHFPDGKYRFIVANLYAELLCQYSAKFLQWIENDGLLILSGILFEQEQSILKCFSKKWTLQKRLKKGKWVCLIFQKYN